jgi:hypothetical protein
MTATAFYDIHGVTVRIRGRHDDVGVALERRLRQFATTSSERVDIDLRLDDEPVAAALNGESRTVYEMHDSELRYFPDDDVLTADLGGVQMRVDARDGRAHISSPRFTGRERYLAAHPLATLALIELLRRHGRFNLHAACLARSDRGVLLAGPSGTGKSTLALALARTDLDYLGDDMLFLASAEDGVRVCGFSDAVGVTPSTRARFAELAYADPEPGYPKSLVRIDEAFDTEVTTTSVATVLVFPEITRAPTSRLERMDPQEAFMRLIPDVLLTDPPTSQQHVAVLAALTGQVDCYRMLTGEDVDAAAALVTELV